MFLVISSSYWKRISFESIINIWDFPLTILADEDILEDFLSVARGRQLTQKTKELSLSEWRIISRICFENDFMSLTLSIHFACNYFPKCVFYYKFPWRTNIQSNLQNWSWIQPLETCAKPISTRIHVKRRIVKHLHGLLSQSRWVFPSVEGHTIVDL